MAQGHRTKTREWPALPAASDSGKARKRAKHGDQKLYAIFTTDSAPTGERMQGHRAEKKSPFVERYVR